MTFFALKRQELLRAEAALAPAAAGRALRVDEKDLKVGGAALREVWAFLGLSAGGAGKLAARTGVQRRSPTRYRNDLFYRCLETGSADPGEHGSRRALDRGRLLKSALR